MNPKVFFVIIGLLVLFFIGGAAVGLTGGLGDDGAAATPAWGETIRDKLAQPLDREDVRTAFPPECREQLAEGVLELPAGGSCTFVISEARAQVRTLTLVLAVGTAVQVQFDPREEGRLTAKETLNGAGEEAEIDIFSEGGTLTVACPGLAPCQLTVGK